MLRFVERVLQSEQLWVLRDKSTSALLPKRYGPLDVMPVWSDRAYATRCAKEIWPTYGACPIALAEFIEDRLPSMATDRVLVAPNWSPSNVRALAEGERLAADGVEVVHPVRLMRQLQEDSSPKGQVIIRIGRSFKGTFMQAVHLPTGKRSHRVYPIGERLYIEVVEELMEQLRNSCCGG